MSEDKQPKHTMEELKQMQRLPLAAKISMTQTRVREWVREYGESGVYISFSGGKDSTALLHIVRKLYPDIEAVFVDTGLEYPEIRKFVKTFDNVTILRPEMRFDEVIKKYGYPMLSKTIAHNVKVAKYNPHGKVKENIFSELKRGPYAMSKWIDLLEADFDICEKCCDITKKKPAVSEDQPVRYVITYKCPDCGGKFTGTVSNYCYHCGQALDWSEENAE